jgi:signal transduction histidine kinase
MSNNSVIISVKNTGVGIEPDEQDKLFQKFRKIERAGLRADIDIQGPA